MEQLVFGWLRRLGKPGENDGPDLSGVVATYASVGFRLGKDAPDRVIDVTEAIVNGALGGGPPTLDRATLATHYLAKVLSSVGQEQEACNWWARTVELGKQSATPSALEAAAWASAELSNSPEWPEHTAGETAAEAVTLGEQSGTCVGYAAAALGALSLGLSQGTKRAKVDWWERAVAFADKSCAPSGRTAGAAAALDLGMEFSDPTNLSLDPSLARDNDKAASWYLKSLALGRAGHQPTGRQYADQAASLLRDLEAHRPG